MNSSLRTHNLTLRLRNNAELANVEIRNLLTYLLDTVDELTKKLELIEGRVVSIDGNTPTGEAGGSKNPKGSDGPSKRRVSTRD